MDRQILNFTANEQILTADEPIRISTNKVNYIEAHFDLGQNWTGYDSIRAVWFNDFYCISTVLDSNGVAFVPSEVMKRNGKVKVNLVGSISENDVLTDRLTSYPIVAVIVDCTAQINGAETAPITPSQFEQYVSIVRGLVDSVKDIDHIELNPDYTLTIYYSDGTSDTTGSVRGADGNGIESVTKTGTSGLVDTYTITFTDGQTATFNVTNGAKGDTGNGIASIEKTSTVGLVDTYTITYTNGNTTTFTVTNGEKGDKGDTGEVSQAELDEAVTDLKSDLNALDNSFYNKYSYNLIDHSDNVGTGAYTVTSRYFVDGIIPANAKINTIKYFCASATSGTITFEVWEFENGTLSKVYDQTETPIASSVNTAHINYYTEKPCMLSFQSSAGNARMDSLATGKSTLYIADLVSDTLSYSSLNSLSGFELCATIDYIISVDKSYVPKTWGVLPAVGETVTNVYTPKYRALLGRSLKKGDYLSSVSVYSRSSVAPGQVKVELWDVSGTTMTLTETFTSSFGSAVGTVTIPIGKVIENDTRITVVYIPTSDSANWAWGRTADNVGTGIYNTSDIASSTLSLPTKSFGDVSSEFILNDYTPYVQMSFTAKNTEGIVTVGKSDGYDFSTIQSAIDGSDEGDTIIVSEGVYEENVKCAGKVRNIVGTNRNRCILINHTGNYYTPPIEMNVGSIENMTIISDASAVDTSADGANLAYCIHCDFDTNSKNNSWIARNLKMENANRPCIGMGLHQDYSVLLENCEMYSGVHVAADARGTMYFHTRNIAGVTHQNIKIKNCEIVCADTVAMTVMQLQSGKGEAEFIGNTVYSEQNGTADSIIWDGSSTVSFNSDFSLSDISGGNTVSIINSL